MIKILWADDQTDIVSTFSSVLAPLNAKISPVKNGNEALKKLLTEYFDLLLLDLKMPPGEWGGLWTLEEIRKFNPKIPVIILSGEGTQNETIKALRLGAQDYVTKDRVQAELLERVKTILREAERRAISDLINHFPTLISFPYKRYMNTSEPVTRLHRLLEFFEAYLRCCCIVGLCELSTSESLHKEGGAFKSLIQSPSMGTWNQARYLIAKHLSHDAVFFQLHHPIENELSASLVRIRNDIAHGAEPSDVQALQYIKECDDSLRDFSKMLWQSLNFEIVFPTKLQFDGTKFEVDAILISGNNSALPKTSLITSTPLISNQSYLIRSGNNTYVNLFPFIVVEAATEPATWRVMIFDGVKMDRNIKDMNGKENIRYIDIASGQRNLIPKINPVSRMLPSFTTGLKEI